jgi:hypothetical protein
MCVGFVELPLYKARCWQKWFSTMSELILEGTTYPRGNLFKWIMQMFLNVRSILSMSSKYFGEISILAVLTPAAFNCTISFFQSWNQWNESFSTFKRQSDKDVTECESGNTEIIFQGCFSNCTEEFRWVPSLRSDWKASIKYKKSSFNISSARWFFIFSEQFGYKCCSVILWHKGPVLTSHTHFDAIYPMFPYNV